MKVRSTMRAREHEHMALQLCALERVHAHVTGKESKMHGHL